MRPKVLLPVPNVKAVTAVKIGKLEHLETLLDGNLRFRDLQYYTNIETSKEPWHDPHEGVAGVLQSKDYEMYITDEMGKETKISLQQKGQIIIRENNPRLRVMCFHAIHAGDLSNIPLEWKNVDKYVEELRITQEMVKFEDYVWVITNFSEFKKRLLSAVVASDCILRGGTLVRYIDFSSSNGEIEERFIGFVKSNKYKNEREFRIILEVEQGSVDPFYLQLGNLDDISKIMSIDSFNRTLKIK
jgi:hypothetical protein